MVTKSGKKRAVQTVPEEPISEAELVLSTSAQPSVVVKIFFLTSFIYLFVMAIYLICKWTFLWSWPDSIWGIDIKWFSVGANVLVLSIAASISAKKFLVTPINKVKEAIIDVSRGDFLARAECEGNDEIGDLAYNFNKMLEKLDAQNADKMQTEYDLLLAREELKYKARLEKRGKTIKKANKALEGLVKDFSLLYELGQSISSTIEISELYRLLQDVLPKRLGLQKFAILIADKKQEFLNIRSANGFEESENIFDLSFRIGEGISGEVVSTGQLLHVPNMAAESRFIHYIGEETTEGSVVSVPLRYKRDILGVMNCARADKNGFSEEDIRLITLVANQIALAVENAKLYTKTRELAVRDELTGIYNRRHFQEVLKMEWKRAIRFKRHLSLLMIDIDHFKKLNDTYGHLYGDKVLREVSNIILKNIREVDTVARFGGEEFVALLPDTDKLGAMVVGEKLRQLVEAQKFDDIVRHHAPLTISTGISVFLEDAKEIDDLIDHADVALYDAKDNGRNRVVVYADITEFSRSLQNTPLTTN